MAPQNLLAQLTHDFHPGRGGKLSHLTITGDGLWVNLDDKAIVSRITDTLINQFRHNLSRGLDLQGSPQLALSGATLERREYRAIQGAQGGKPKRALRPSNEAYAKQKYRQRFQAARLGHFQPMGGSVPGIESGMLANSVAAKFLDNRTIGVYFAGKRGKFADRTGDTAVDRVFRRMGAQTRILEQLSVRSVMKDTIGGIVAVGRSAAQLIIQAGKAARAFTSLADSFGIEAE